MNEINGPAGTTPRDVGDTSGTPPARSQSVPAKGAGAASSSRPSDQVSLTNHAANLKALEKHITELPVVDTQRVEQVQQSIAAGNYEIQPARVADKMLNFEAGLPDTDKEQ